jgi:hypothetical protein
MSDQMPPPISLSDIAMAQLMAACRPLPAVDRTRFLQLVAERLNGKREVGDGEIFRLIREAQRAVFDPPHLGTYGKYR